MRIANQDWNRNASTVWSAVVASQILLITAVLFPSGSAQTANETCVAFSTRHNTAPTLVIGFVGGLVHHDDLRHSEVQLARRLQATYGDGVKVQIFENRRRADANRCIVRWLNGLDYGAGEPTRQPNIVLFGHSWGAAAAVYLARELDREGIRVALTVQVDSVPKHGEDDSVIPANVDEAVNFYQSKGLIHGRSEILAADPAHTKILGNFHFKYQDQPAECRSYPWYDRIFFKGHTSIECDPRLWSAVEALIESCVTRARPAQREVAAQLLRHSLGQDPAVPKPAWAQPCPGTALVNPAHPIQ